MSYEALECLRRKTSAARHQARIEETIRAAAKQAASSRCEGGAPEEELSGAEFEWTISLILLDLGYEESAVRMPWARGLGTGSWAAPDAAAYRRAAKAALDKLLDWNSHWPGRMHWRLADLVGVSPGYSGAYAPSVITPESLENLAFHVLTPEDWRWVRAYARDHMERFASWWLASGDSEHACSVQAWGEIVDAYHPDRASAAAIELRAKEASLRVRSGPAWNGGGNV